MEVITMNVDNHVLNTIQNRRSIRKFKPDMVPKVLLEQIITAGTCAPSAMNTQSPIIVAVTNKEIRDQLSRMNAKIMGSSNDPFYGAPVVLIVLAKKDCPNRVYDGSLVMGNLMLAAHAVGLGTCWIHRAKQEFETEEGQKILKSLGIEEEYEGIGHCVLGYTDGEAPKAPVIKEHRVYHID